MLQNLNRQLDQPPNPRPTKWQKFGKATDASTNGINTAYSEERRY